MLEIRITAPELSEAINNLARALDTSRWSAEVDTIVNVPPISSVLSGAVTAAAADLARTNIIPTEAETVVNPTTPVSAPQTAPVVPTASSVNYPTPEAPAVPVANNATTTPTAPEKQYTLEEIAKAGTALVDAGKIAEVSALLGKYGVEVLTAVNPSMYGAIAADLRALGAPI